MPGWIQLTFKQSLQGCVEESITITLYHDVMWYYFSLHTLLLHFLLCGYFIESLKSVTVSLPLLFFYFILFCHMVYDDCVETSHQLQCHIAILYISSRVVFVDVAPFQRALLNLSSREVFYMD